MTAPVQKTVVATVADDCTEACAAAIRDALNPVLLQPLIAIVTGYAVRRVMPTIVSYREFAFPTPRFQPTRERSYNILTHDKKNIVRIVDFGGAPERTIPYKGKTVLGGRTRIARSDNDEFIFYAANNPTFEVGTIKDGAIQHHSSHDVEFGVAFYFQPRFSTCLFHNPCSVGNNITTYKIGSKVNTFAPSIKPHYLVQIEDQTLLSISKGWFSAGGCFDRIQNIGSQAVCIKSENADYSTVTTCNFDQTRFFASSLTRHEVFVFSLPDLKPLPTLTLEGNGSVRAYIHAIAVNSYSLCKISNPGSQVGQSILYDLETGKQMMAFDIDSSPSMLTPETFALSDDYLGITDENFGIKDSITRIYDLRDPSKPIAGAKK